MADAHPKFDVSVVTPDGPAFEGEAEMLIVPGAAGEIGVLARHAPLVATLKAGSTRVHLGGNEVIELATGPGSSRSRPTGRSRSSTTPSTCKEIDDARAQAQLEAAGPSSRSSTPGGSGDRWQLEQRIVHAENQLPVSGRTTG